MAYLRFLKENEPSQKKNYIPESIKAHKYRKIWKILSIIEGLVIIGLLFLQK